MMVRKLLITLTAAALAAFAFASIKSGLEVGEMVTPFHPKHLSGPDKGTDTCPPCKYGARPAVQVWNNGDSSENIAKLAKVLSGEVADSKADFKAFVINLTSTPDCEKAAKEMASKLPYENIAITMLPTDNSAIKNYKVNVSPEVKNTVFVYRNKKVVAKFVNLEANEKGLGELKAAIARAEQ